jgi:hypothetical protein
MQELTAPGAPHPHPDTPISPSRPHPPVIMDNKTTTAHSKEDLAAIEAASAALQKASLNANSSTFTPAAPVNHVFVKLA